MHEEKKDYKPGIAIGTLNADTTVSVTGSTFINCRQAIRVNTFMSLIRTLQVISMPTKVMLLTKVRSS